MTISGFMWYGSPMNPENLVGKPLVIFVDGEKRQIGTITQAKIVSGKLFTAAEIDLSTTEGKAAAEAVSA